MKIGMNTGMNIGLNPNYSARQNSLQKTQSRINQSQNQNLSFRGDGKLSPINIMLGALLVAVANVYTNFIPSVQEDNVLENSPLILEDLKNTIELNDSTIKSIKFEDVTGDLFADIQLEDKDGNIITYDPKKGKKITETADGFEKVEKLSDIVKTENQVSEK